MTDIHLTLNNFNDFSSLLTIFPESKDFEFTAKKIFRRQKSILCSCGCLMNHNGYDYVRKKGFGKVKIGKQLCPKCNISYHEDKGFWKNLLSRWYSCMSQLVMLLRDSNVAWHKISSVMNFIIPSSKDSLRKLFNKEIEQFEYPQENYLIVNYDEQHPKKGRMQKFRLTLLNYETKIPIAEGLFDNKDSDTIEQFLRDNLDISKKLVIITDCDRRYPEIFRKIWEKNLVHQKCLLHLNKLIVGDFEKNTSLLEEYNKYLLLNIFYNRRKEQKFLERLMLKERKQHFSHAKMGREWVFKSKEKFRAYIKKLEHKRRREGKNLTQRSLLQATKIFETLWTQKTLFYKKSQNRLKMIKENWNYFTAFYTVKNCPATNNAVENFYSTSLKTHRKKQLRTDEGITNHMKLSALKRTKNLTKPKNTIIEIYALIKQIT